VRHGSPAADSLTLASGRNWPRLTREANFPPPRSGRECPPHRVRPSRATSWQSISRRRRSPYPSRAS